MTNTAIVAIVFGAIALVAVAGLIWTQRTPRPERSALTPLAHRGECAEGHADDVPSADDLDPGGLACALTGPLETAPSRLGPDFLDFEREMAHVNVARISSFYLDNGSNY